MMFGMDATMSTGSDPIELQLASYCDLALNLPFIPPAHPHTTGAHFLVHPSISTPIDLE
jgi:hypothetical protein